MHVVGFLNSGAVSNDSKKYQLAISRQGLPLHALIDDLREASTQSSPPLDPKKLAPNPRRSARRQLHEDAPLDVSSVPEAARRTAHTPLTRAQMAANLTPSRARLSPREVSVARTQWKDAQVSKWLSQKAGHYIPRQRMTEERRAALKECFCLFDKDGSGEIDFSELSAAMKTLGFSSAEIRTAIKAGDHDGDGMLDFEEFVATIELAGGRGKDSENSFPFSLIASSYRITCLIDSYRPEVRLAGQLGYPARREGHSPSSPRTSAGRSSSDAPPTPRSLPPLTTAPARAAASPSPVSSMSARGDYRGGRPAPGGNDLCSSCKLLGL
jgi:hypothetical protein